MRNARIRALATALVVMGALSSSPRAAHRGSRYFMYVGTYTQGAAKGIYGYRVDTSTGATTSIGLVAETPNPSFLVVHPNGRFLYAANEHDGEDAVGKHYTVSAFAIDRKTGALTLLNKVSSQGEGPCYVSMDGAGRTLLVANYRSGSVAVLPVGADGRLAEATAVQQHPDPEPRTPPVRPHAHSVRPSPHDKFVYAPDPPLGRVYGYRFDPRAGTLAPTDPPFVQMRAGLGPRHVLFGLSGQFAYVNGEQGSTITTFAYNAATGALTELQTLSTLPAGFTGRSGTAELQIDQTGRFLYVSNRGDNSLALFAIDRRAGTLTPLGHLPTGGKVPRYFALDPSGRFLMAANQDSASVTINRVDAKTGRYELVQTLTEIPNPVCIVFVPAAG
ncbi:MAG: lactonase family protein [Acidobacteriota bacterium]